MNKIIFSLIVLINSSIFSMSQQDLDEQLELEIMRGDDDDQIRKIRKLLDEGANPKVKINNEFAHVYCAKRGSWVKLDQLIEHGIDINMPINELDENLAMYLTDRFLLSWNRL